MVRAMNTVETRTIRLTLSAVWLVTGALSLGIYPLEDSLALLSRIGLAGTPSLIALYLGAITDIVMGLLTLFIRSKSLWIVQGLLILAYTLIISIGMPEFWLHPFGPLLKNLPILLLLWLLYQHEGEPQ